MPGQLLKRGERRWLIRVFVGRDARGKRTYENQTVLGTKREAEAALADLLSKRNNGQLVLRTKVTVNDHLDEWLRDTVAPKRRVRTVEDYAYTLDRYVRPHLGAMAIQKVEPKHVRAMINTLRKTLSGRTVRKAHEVIRNALEGAVAEGILKENPARGALVKAALPPIVRVERETVPIDKVQKFVEATEGRRLRAYWLTLLFGGFRPEEALALRWTDLRGDAVTVRRVFSDKPGKPLRVEDTKSTTSARTVILPVVVLDALKEHRTRQAEDRLKAGPAWHDEGLVFCNEVGEPLRQDRTRDEYKALLKAAELPPMRIYDLRHSAGTLLLEMGEDVAIVSKMLGHSSIQLTVDTYGHVTRGMQQRTADRFNQLTATG
jgi:integrase